MIKSLSLILILFLCSCKTNTTPADILPPQKMEPLLWDLVRADQLLTLQYTTDTTVNRTTKSREVYQQVLTLHKVSEADFKKSFAFYQRHPAQLKTVLDSMRNRKADYTTPSVKPMQ